MSFFCNATATSVISTLSLHDALPIFVGQIREDRFEVALDRTRGASSRALEREDRKSTRLNSSHITTSYAVFCLKKKNVTIENGRPDHLVLCLTKLEDAGVEATRSTGW